ncbi:hypothetical protein GGTG_05049 [Gaeumannomyces tritici R3-111a-1]|uniref:Uncharacterized protein n=1 Tax=Gaeumannomyces tritici (strain R3-111a-1) TaxID=644352 RepID=J3NUU3_GAET3|nr:hypothetical protein GGTG_05049 [Gaeumannomyces tritici R3-111a-1]EJT79967.1 hypothetical protein GGTG_05049 [Gaeumannomyces tritici R3-111a-1]
MASIIDPYMSNGTCYFAAGKRSHSSFIPCGNDAIGRQTCCSAADFCLSSNACFNAEFKQTYLAGCTDPRYDHDKCPVKPNLSNEPWTGLSYCNGTSEEWFACRKGGSSTLRSGDPCFCPEEPRTIAFKDKSVLERIASLPRTTGSRISFEPDHYPSPQIVVVPTTINGQSTSVSSSVPLSTLMTSTGTGGGAVPVETSPSTDAAPQPSSDLSTAAKAGIGAGVAFAGLAALAALLFFFLKRRKEAKADGASDFGGGGGGGGGGNAKHTTVFDPHAPHHGHESGDRGGFDSKNHAGFDRYSDAPPAQHVMPSPVTPAVSELSATAARPWSMRSELHGSEQQPSPRGSPAPPSSSPDQQGAYRPYNPSLVPAALVPGGSHAQPQNVNRNGALTPVAELP